MPGNATLIVYARSTSHGFEYRGRALTYVSTLATVASAVSFFTFQLTVGTGSTRASEKPPKMGMRQVIMNRPSYLNV